jgi:hypothetical protein
MYKEVKNKMQKNEVETSYSEEEVLEIFKDIILKKSQDYKDDVDIEELRKNWRKAFAKGLTVLGMLHGAHYMGRLPQPKSEREKSPIYQRAQERLRQRKPSSGLSDEEQIKQSREQARQEGQEIYNKYGKNSRNSKINDFLKTISMNESSGGKNLNHKQMKSGMHRGDSAVGQYGLMPNTIKEMANRMGKDNPMSMYGKMDNQAISDSIKKNPEHENEIAKFMANHLHDKFGGDENKMSYSWFQGHNLTNDHFDTSHKNYMNHDYVKKYNKHKSQIDSQKTPQKNTIASN